MPHANLYIRDVRDIDDVEMSVVAPIVFCSSETARRLARTHRSSGHGLRPSLHP
ncbi:MAG: hypothetical protein M3Q27_03220 [Actinomycetota bacterium]|nr:hypothetical protein [Actinomycetota bacterium]